MAQSNEQGGEELTFKIYEAMQVPYLSERHDAIKALILADRKQHELEAKIAVLEGMRDQMFNMYHIVSATMNDKQAISAFDYEFEERIAELKAEREAL